MTATATRLEQDEVATWYVVTGFDHKTAWEFEEEDVYGVTGDDRILDCDGCPLTPGDVQEVAVRNALAGSVI